MSADIFEQRTAQLPENVRQYHKIGSIPGATDLKIPCAYPICITWQENEVEDIGILMQDIYLFEWISEHGKATIGDAIAEAKRRQRIHDDETEAERRQRIHDE